MTYFRLRDIKTPPFAYVTNKEEAVRACRGCEMPFRGFETSLCVEIITTESDDWESRLRGRPLLADHWLIGDESFAATLEDNLPGMFEKIQVDIASWMTRSISMMLSSPGDALMERSYSFQPDYFYFKPVHSIALAGELLESFPPITCRTCGREIPELPFDFQPIPDPGDTHHPVVSLHDLYLEGYDYLFHSDVAQKISLLFPEMILERVAAEPLCI